MELTVHQHIKETMDLRVKAALSSWMELTVHQQIKETIVGVTKDVTLDQKEWRRSTRSTPTRR